MIYKEEWLSRHKQDEKAWNDFKKYCTDRGFGEGKRNGEEVIYAPACGLVDSDRKEHI